MTNVQEDHPMPSRKPQLRLVGNQESPSSCADEPPVAEAQTALEAVNHAQEAEQGFGNLMTWLHGPVAMKMDADRVEKNIDEAGCEVLRRSLQEHFRARGLGHVGSTVEIVRDDEVVPLEQGRVHSRNYESLFGGISVDRQAYSAPGQSSLHPLDEELNLPARKYSHPVQERVVRNVARGPYQEALQTLQESTGAHVPNRQAQELSLEATVHFEDFYEQRSTEAQAASQTGSLLVAGVDAKGVPRRRTPEEKAAQRARGRAEPLASGEKRQKKQMATVASVHTQEPWVRTPEQVVEQLLDPDPPPLETPRPKAEHRRLWASLQKPKDEVFQEVAEEMRARDPEQQKTAVCLTDGERALQKRAQKYLCAVFPALLVILDIMHVLKYLWDAAHCFHDVGTEEARQWVRERLLEILRGNVSRVAAGIRQSATKQGLRRNRRKTVDKACNYLLNNKAYMHYDEYLAAGMPIASGNVEGACGHLVKDRMEKTGANWTETGAEAVLKLRSIEKSGDFEEYWAYHLEHERKWNYRENWQVAA
jgi:hypothetical protein